jgi:hypothetical protein
MFPLQTYNPARVAAAYSPNRPSWPLAVWLTLVISQAAIAKPSTGRLPDTKPMRLGAHYVPQAVSCAAEGALDSDDLLAAVGLSAMPKRRYQIKMQVKEISKGRLRM